MSVGKTVTGTLGCTSVPRMKLKVATETVQELYKQSLAHRRIPLATVYLRETPCQIVPTQCETGALPMSSRPAHNPSWHTSTGPGPIPIAFLTIGSQGCHGSSVGNRANGYLSKRWEQEEWSIVDVGLRVFPPHAEAIQLFHSRCCRSHHVRATECV